MKPNLKHIRKHRKFSDDFRRQMVKEFEAGKHSVAQLSKHYHLSPQTIYNWIYKFSTFNEKGYRIVEIDHSKTIPELFRYNSVIRQ
ncbi:MAG: transposase [Bacteroidia bacterium]|nr:transposase [Bacteroidia bacterium]